MTQEQLFSCNPGKGYIFTDSRKDGLMAMAVERFNRIPEGAQAGSRELSEKIRDFKVSADIYKTGDVKVQFALLVGAEKYETFTLKGRMRNWRGKTRVDVDLNKVEKAGWGNRRSYVRCGGIRWRGRGGGTPISWTG